MSYLSKLPYNKELGKHIKTTLATLQKKTHFPFIWKTWLRVMKSNPLPWSYCYSLRARRRTQQKLSREQSERDSCLYSEVSGVPLFFLFSCVWRERVDFIGRERRERECVCVWKKRGSCREQERKGQERRIEMYWVSGNLKFTWDPCFSEEFGISPYCGSYVGVTASTHAALCKL